MKKLLSLLLTFVMLLSLAPATMAGEEPAQEPTEESAQTAEEPSEDPANAPGEEPEAVPSAEAEADGHALGSVEPADVVPEEADPDDDPEPLPEASVPADAAPVLDGEAYDAYWTERGSDGRPVYIEPQFFFDFSKNCWDFSWIKDSKYVQFEYRNTHGRGGTGSAIIGYWNYHQNNDHGIDKLSTQELLDLGATAGFIARGSSIRMPAIWR